MPVSKPSETRAAPKPQASKGVIAAKSNARKEVEEDARKPKRKEKAPVQKRKPAAKPDAGKSVPCPKRVRKDRGAGSKGKAPPLIGAGLTASMAPHAARCYYIPEEMGPRRPFRDVASEPCDMDAFVQRCPCPNEESDPKLARYGYAGWDAFRVAQELMYSAKTPADERNVLGAALAQLVHAGGDLPLVPGAHYFTGHRKRHRDASSQLNVCRVVLHQQRMELKSAAFRLPFDRTMSWITRSTLALDLESGSIARIHAHSMYLHLPACSFTHNEYRQSEFRVLAIAPGAGAVGPELLQRQASLVFVAGRTWEGEADVANRRAVVGLDPVPDAVLYSVLFSNGRRDVAYTNVRMFAEFRAWSYVEAPLKEGNRTVPGLALFSEPYVQDVWFSKSQDEAGCLCARSRVGVSKRLVPVALALRHMHARGFVHRCVIPDSVKCCALDNGWVLTNMAHVRRIGEDASDPVPGTECYAPLRVERADPQHDVYMLAGLVYHVLTGIDPYAKTNVDTRNMAIHRASSTRAHLSTERLRRIREQRHSGSAHVNWQLVSRESPLTAIANWAARTLESPGEASLDALLDLLLATCDKPPPLNPIGFYTAKPWRFREIPIYTPGRSTTTVINDKELKDFPWPAPEEKKGASQAPPENAVRNHIAAMIGGVVLPIVAQDQRFCSSGTAKAPLLTECKEGEEAAGPPRLLDAIVASRATPANDVWVALKRLASSVSSLSKSDVDALLA